MQKLTRTDIASQPSSSAWAQRTKVEMAAAGELRLIDEAAAELSVDRADYFAFVPVGVASRVCAASAGKPRCFCSASSRRYCSVCGSILLRPDARLRLS
jgi:hypothetical protein